ncbi:MAG: hypothetical protein FWF03_06990, partial [Defluviitaleaceae bacterium]|nr:hypothetical protein [Defluviitaleaceae bacterium]
MDSFYPLINEICEDYSIRCEALSGGWLLRLEKNGKVRSIIGRHFDVNSASADRVACDKCACYEMLKRGGIEAVECELFLDPLRRRNWIGGGGEFSRATDYFNSRGQKVVVKPNEGWQGREVYLCETVKQLERAMLAAYKEGPGICLSPFAEIKNEYRAYHVNGECPLAYGKERASAIGDGCSTVSQFAKESRVPDDCHYFPKGPDYVPAPGERALLSWKHNLSNGARAFFIGDAKLK